MSGSAEPAGLTVRRLVETDDLDALTDLLHRAYGPLAERGMRYLATHQDASVTRDRVAAGECWVATDAAGAVVATVVLVPPDRPCGEAAYYARPDVAHFGQFAVEPAWQSRGVGSRLLELVEERARALGAAHLALDTAEIATDLIAFYERRGYAVVGHESWDETNYRSVIMSKRLGEGGGRV